MKFTQWDRIATAALCGGAIVAAAAIMAQPSPAAPGHALRVGELDWLTVEVSQPVPGPDPVQPIAAEVPAAVPPETLESFRPSPDVADADATAPALAAMQTKIAELERRVAALEPRAISNVSQKPVTNAPAISQSRTIGQFRAGGTMPQSVCMDGVCTTATAATPARPILRSGILRRWRW